MRANVSPTKRISRFLLLAAAMTALVAGTATAEMQTRTAKVLGVIRLCGGPAPSRCFHQNGLVSAIGTSGRVVASERTRHASFSFALAPGRYTLVATTGGALGQRQITLAAHETLHVNVVIPIR
jgi:hypothetical protein